MDVLIVRDPRESTKKCSLKHLHATPGIRFVRYAPDRRVDAGRRILLHPDGEELRPDDSGPGLLLVDCAWRRVDQLLGTIDGDLMLRRLPPLHTAYPRRSNVFEDPSAGLASIEALFAALWLLGDRRPDLLDDYRWREEFLRLNPRLRADDAG
jgi:rRNA small subunit aminocarboxypropyltransferase